MSKERLEVGDAFAYTDGAGHREHFGMVTAPGRALLFIPSVDGTGKAAREDSIPSGAYPTEVYLSCHHMPEEVSYAILAIRVALSLTPETRGERSWEAASGHQ